MSELLEEAGYKKALFEELHRRALAAMGDPAYSKVTQEYKQHAGVWATSTVLLSEQVQAALQEAGAAENKGSIASALDGIPRLDDAASGCRVKYLETAAKKRLAELVPETPADKERSERTEKIRKLTADAAEKLRKECQQRKLKVAERREELAQLASTEFLRREFGKGKKQRECPENAQERLKKACRCYLTKLQASTKTSATSCRATCARSSGPARRTEQISSSSCAHAPP